MKHLILSLICAVALARPAYSITATKAYVDASTSAVYRAACSAATNAALAVVTPATNALAASVANVAQAATNYTDLAVQQAGGMTPLAVTNVALAVVTPATNELAASVANVAQSSTNYTDAATNAVSAIRDGVNEIRADGTVANVISSVWTWTAYGDVPDDFLSQANAYGAPRPYYLGGNVWLISPIGDSMIRNPAEGDRYATTLDFPLHKGDMVFHGVATRQDATGTTYVAVARLATTNELASSVAAATNGLITASAATNAAAAVVAATRTAYAATNAIVSLNQSVQYVVANGTPLSIAAPAPETGGIRDWLVYVNATADTPLDLSALSGVLASDASATNAAKANAVTMLAFTEMTNGVYILGRSELKPVK